MVFGAILGAKMVPKWIQKSIKKIMDFGIAPEGLLGAKRGPRGIQVRLSWVHGEG